MRTVLLVELLVLALFGYGLWLTRAQVLVAEAHVLELLARAMASQIDRTLQAGDVALQATRIELADGLVEPGDARAHDILHTRASALPMFNALAIVDRHGLQVNSSRDDPAQPVDLADRDYFRAWSGGRKEGLYLSPAFLSRATGKPSIAMSLGWYGHDRQFGGVLLAVADASIFDASFAALSPAREAHLALLRDDGTLLNGELPEGPRAAAVRALSDAPPTPMTAEGAPRLARTLVRATGGVESIALQPLTHFPLTVAVSRDSAPALATWRSEALIAGALTLLALAGVLAFSLHAAREGARRGAAQERLDAEQRRLLAVFDSSQEGFWSLDVGSDAAFLSPRMKEMHGLPRDGAAVTRTELLGRALHPDDVARQRQALQDHIEGRSSAYDVRYRVRDPAGGWRWVHARGSAQRGPGGHAGRVTGVAFDVTLEEQAREEAERLARRMQQVGKMESLGTLAGGIAHDFNNVLAAVIGYGEMARQAAPGDSAQTRHLDQVLQAGQRGKALVERILSFSRSGLRPRSRFAVQPVVSEVLAMLGGSLPDSLRLEPRLAAPQACVEGDPTLVFEAVMNLCTNAMQAMPEGGRLGVDLREQTLEQAMIVSHGTVPPGRFACLAVSDTGTGMDAAMLERVFEPFFTTKGPHAGTGLGLAVVHSAVADLGGVLDVCSQPGQGSTFTLFLPLVEAEVDHPAAEPGTGPPGQGQVVMVVDDEPALVDLAEELLAELGYEPVGFRSSVSALAEFRRRPDHFDLLLTDQVMPGMTGLELSAAVRKLRPDLPILLATGYGGPQLPGRAGAAGVTALLNKPFTRAEMARALNTALRRP